MCASVDTSPTEIITGVSVYAGKNTFKPRRQKTSDARVLLLQDAEAPGWFRAAASERAESGPAEIRHGEAPAWNRRCGAPAPGGRGSAPRAAAAGPSRAAASGAACYAGQSRALGRPPGQCHWTAGRGRRISPTRGRPRRKVEESDYSLRRAAAAAHTCVMALYTQRCFPGPAGSFHL
ncbi:unnamed protein product [Symbiodinium necroappetens]|uniref:Uncharacterized protein n=1 Tax=Symbiodinium necroappetens TaxID=1628268 RepID=A0A812Q255_9DINO|nr:unnamed protein product [Symbiodinium necroappetens]